MAAGAPADVITQPSAPRTICCVLADVDASLAAWLSNELPAGTTIDFASPAGLVDHRRSGRSACTVNLFLHDIVADPAGQSSTEVYLRDSRGRVCGVQSPLRRYRLSYLVTAWGADTDEEHRLLGLVLAAHGGVETLTGERLHGVLRELDIPVPIELGLVGRGPGEPGMWASLGLPARASFELCVTAPVPPVVRTDIAPQVRRVGVDVHRRDALPAGEVS
jgi:hypothetical protein